MGKMLVKLSMREILVLTSVHAHPPSVHIDFGGGGGESKGNPTGGGEYNLFFSWREMSMETS